jgi:hypothetical protein
MNLPSIPDGGDGARYDFCASLAIDPCVTLRNLGRRSLGPSEPMAAGNLSRPEDFGILARFEMVATILEA